MMARRVRLVLAALVALAAPCGARQILGTRSRLPAVAPAADAPFLPYDAAWPARVGPADGAVRGVVREFDTEVSSFDLFRPDDALTPGRSDLSDAGALGALLAPGERVAFEGPGATIFRFNIAPQFVRRSQKAVGVSWCGVFISGQRAEGGSGATIQRTWFAEYDPVGAGGGPAPPIRGTALVMPGLLGTPRGTIDLLVLRLRERGWVVLRMLGQPSRFMERVELKIDVRTDPVATIPRIAAMFDDRTAECAYAVQGALADLERRRPDLRPMPRVVIGMSGGAITLPPVVAREPGRYGAAVLVAGGADFFLATSRSTYSGFLDAATFEWTPRPPTEEELRGMDAVYLDRARLDAYHTAAALHGVPMLVVHGAADEAVPAALGDCLWERLGRPERVVKSVGHELVFAALPADFARILAFLDESVPRPGAP